MAITVNYPLQIQGSGTVDALALKGYAGIMSEAWEKATKFFDDTGSILSYADISSGNSTQFPQIGFSSTPEDHAGDGSDVTRTEIDSDEAVVTVDDEVVNTIGLPVASIHKSHFDPIAPRLRKLAYSIALEYDSRIARTGLLAARTAAVSGIHNGGNRVTRNGTGTDFSNAYPDNATGAAALRDDVAALAYEMDVDDIPRDGRFLYVHPWFKRIMRHETDVFDANLSDGPIPNDIVRRSLGMLEDFVIIETNNLPSTNVTTGPTKYQGDFRTAGTPGRPIALALCGAMQGAGAIGVVTLMGMELAMDEKIQRLQTRAIDMQAAIHMGVGIVNPWCAGEIAVTNP